jgi:hypothetical protein
MVAHPDAALWLASLRGRSTLDEPRRLSVGLYLIAVGRQLGLPAGELIKLGLIGLLADIGTTHLPRSLLSKPGMLSAAEYRLVQRHVDLGLDALRAAGELPVEVLQGIAQHHERLDGSGYPRGLRGGQISLYGRMAALADVFSALITPRAYAEAMSPYDALINLHEWSEISFDEPLLEQFVHAMGAFPVGHLVELSTGAVGVVVTRRPSQPREPQILQLTDENKQPLSRPVATDLVQPRSSDPSPPPRIMRGLPAGAYGLRAPQASDPWALKPLGKPNT